MESNCWHRPDLPSKCTYTNDTPLGNSPHKHLPFSLRPKIADGVLELFGHTPLVRLKKIPQSEGLECEILAKCEFLSAGGSVKDRIGRRMVEQAEKSGQLKPGDTLIEPTSGNTGIALALTAAVKGYQCIMVMPERMSKEKEYMLKALGAEIVRTRTSAKFDDLDSHLCTAEALRRKIGQTAHILDQYTNPYNPIEHYDQTAEEIIHDCTEGIDNVKLSMVVAGAGTGGTITGLLRKLKQKVPSCKIIAADPVGSILAPNINDTVKTYHVEGLGYDFVPTVLDREGVDKWYKASDQESFLMARRLIKEEGLLCGGSSGAAMVAALKAAREFNLSKDDRVVVLLPDSIRNYMTKLLSDHWLYSVGMIDFPLGENFQKNWILQPTLKLLNTIRKPLKMNEGTAIREAVARLKANDFEQAIITTNDEKVIVGVLDSSAVRLLLDGTVNPRDPVRMATNKNVRQIPHPASVELVGRALTTEPYVIMWNSTVPWLITQGQFLKWTVSQSE
ncbi:unnamed protein product [Calicophoron daubneyi]|uniref:Cystathionine beta-synthase n=1 Tax=Calicophoron daubneyi TaxID=300641 RepID=A0AAV2TMD2_CALDB